MYHNYSSLAASCLPAFGGDYGTCALAGAFFFYEYYSAAGSSVSIGCRLMFL
jgi:hypothetical protein